MSVTIFWRPLNLEDKRFSGTSNNLKVLKEVFGGNNPIRKQNIETLRAMARASNDPFYDAVADAIYQHGDIEIWGDY